MAGVELREGRLVVDREPNRLDDLAISFSAILEDLAIDHVFVSGYVSILAGRARSTEDIDALLEHLDSATASALVDRLTEDGYWGPAMPLASLPAMLDRGDPIWVAPGEQVTPHIEAKPVRDEFDRGSLSGRVPAQIGDRTIPIGPLELQIAYKLSLGSRRDLEDAVHLYTIFEEDLDSARLEQWVEKLGVREDYERLQQY